MAASKSASRALTLVAAGALMLGLSACSGGDSDDSASGDSGSGDLTTVDFVAVGPEGGWRDANEQAIKDAFSEDAGFDLKYAPAASPTDQKSQVDAFTTFVNDEVDVILLTAHRAGTTRSSSPKRPRSPSSCSTAVSTRATTSTSRASPPTT